MFNIRRTKTSPVPAEHPPEGAAQWQDDDPLEELGRLIDRDMRGDGEAAPQAEQAWYAEPANDPHADHWYADAALRGSQEAHGYDPAYDNGAHGDAVYDEAAYAADADADVYVDPVTGQAYVPAGYDEPAYEEPAYADAPAYAAAPYAAAPAAAAAPARSSLADPWDSDYPGSYDDALAGYGDPSTGVDPQLVEHGTLPPHDERETAAAPGGARRIGVIAAVLGVVLLGGIGAVAYGLTGGAGGGEAELVRAPDGPFKIVPDPAEPVDDGAGEGAVVFNAKTGTLGKSEERIIPREESVPGLPGVDSPVAGVVLPDGTLREEAPVDIGPKKVRTVLVRPDGTIITSPDRPTQLAAPTDVPADTGFVSGDDFADEGQLMSAMPTLIDGADQVDQTAALPGTEAPAPTETAALAPLDAPAPATETVPPVEAAAPAPPSAAVPRPSERPGEGASGPMELMPDPATATAPPQQTAALAPEPAPAAPAPAAATGGPGFRVQLASLPSESAAQSTATRLKQRFAAVIGSFPTEIQRADLGAKGVYYRVKVGPMSSSEEANRVCSQLKSAGGDCIVSRN